MKSPAFTSRLLILATATALMVLSSTMAWATLNDFAARSRVPAGVTIAGVDLAGLTRAQAADTITAAVSAPALRPLSVQVGEKTFSFDPRGAVTVDVDTMLDDAFSARGSATYLSRVAHDIAGLPLSLEVAPRFSVDESMLSAWLEGVAGNVDRKARDARISVEDGSVRIQESREGSRTDVVVGARALREAFSVESVLRDRPREVSVPVKVLAPKITEDDLGKTIVVDLSERRIRLFDGERLEKTYPCAIGTPSYPTPQGEFEIVLKRYLPTWVNPAPNGWGADMPRSIGPGPTNPLGTRALNLSAPAIRFHGTTDLGSIGTAASHGCMRMRRPDIEDFYERVEVGTKVFILP